MRPLSEDGGDDDGEGGEGIAGEDIELGTPGRLVTGEVAEELLDLDLGLFECFSSLCFDLLEDEMPGVLSVLRSELGSDLEAMERVCSVFPMCVDINWFIISKQNG